MLPPILILLDSSLANVRLRAVNILSNLLDRIDESILAKIGLVEVIWTAVIPNLASLPPVTDLDESVVLVRATYPTLIKLSKLWHPSLPKRVQLLDKLVRDGVIYAMSFCGDQLRIAQVELEALELLVNEMGIYFVKHLKVALLVILSN
jgi:Tti2 family